MAFEIEGEGEAVLMIHGLGGTANTFTPVMPAFARHRVIRFDLPGSGRSHRVEGSLSLALFGPLLAPPEPARGPIRARGAQAREGDMQPIADALVRASLSAETRARRPAAVAFVRESLLRPDPEGYARSCEALAEMRPVDTSPITCPTLLVTGDEDAVAPPHAVRMMGERIAGSRVEVLRGCGHWTPVEKPEECTALLQRFLSERRSTWRTSSSRTSASSTRPALSPIRARS